VRRRDALRSAGKRGQIGRLRDVDERRSFRGLICYGAMRLIKFGVCRAAAFAVGVGWRGTATYKAGSGTGG
jgi:hypothetical protein